MSRTVSTHMPTQLHEELRERCNKLGCSISDYIAESVKFAMYEHSIFDFSDPDDQEDGKFQT